MKSNGLKTLLALILSLGLAGVAFAEENEGPEGRPEGGRRPRMRQHRRGGPGGRDRRGGQRGPRARMRRRMRHRAIALHKLRNTDEGKAEVERFKTAMKALGEEHKTLRETIRKEIKEGDKDPKEVFESHADELKALAKKGALLRIEHREKMLGVARQNVDKLIDEMHDKMKEHAGRRMEGRRGEDGEGDEDRPPRPRFRRRRHDDDGDGEGDEDRPPRPRFRRRRRRDRDEDGEGDGPPPLPPPDEGPEE